MNKYLRFLLPPPIVVAIELYEYLSRVKGKKIAVLGMKGAGKTRFYRFLQGKPFVEGEDMETIKEQYAGFKYTKSDGKEIKIRGGYDYGGGIDMAELTNEKLISESDTIFFIFDLNEYLSKEKYKDDTNARLNFVVKTAEKEKKVLYVFGSHIDQINVGNYFKKTKEKIELYFEKMGYKGLKRGNLAFVNLTNEDEMKSIVDKLF